MLRFRFEQSAPLGVLAIILFGCPDSGNSATAQAEAEAPPTAGAPAEAPPSATPAETPPASPPTSPPVRRDGTLFGTSELMGTTVSLNVYVGDQGDPSHAGAAMERALAEMARIETMMSEWRPDSELSRLNDGAGGPPTPISPDLFDVLTTARHVHDETDGAFDVTFHGVGHLWSFKAGSTPPTRAAVANALPLVDGTAIELVPEPRTVRLEKPGMKVGLGAIAKGYAVDRASKVLLEAGFPNHVVEAGGDTYAAGSKGEQPWRVGVKDPGSAGSVGVLSVRGRAVVTSGDYMRFFEYEGRRYAHILDPDTGWPIDVDRSPRSVTLLAANATTADAYCTAVTVMGPNEGLAFVEARDDLDAVIIERDGTIRVSSGLAEVYEALPPPAPG